MLDNLVLRMMAMVRVSTLVELEYALMVSENVSTRYGIYNVPHT